MGILWRRLIVVAGLVAALVLAMTPEAWAAQGPFEVVAAGLDNPRGLAFGPDRALYIAEAGRGGAGPCAPGPEGGDVCIGASGAVTRVWRGQQTRIASGLASLAAPGGFAATGPHDVAPNGAGRTIAVIGLGGNVGFRAKFGPIGAGLGQLVQITATGLVRTVADVSTYEESANPDGGIIDSNPYAVVSRGAVRLVADAGGNDLLGVGANGRIVTVAVFPDRMVDAPPFLGLPPGAKIPMQSVPNAVAIGPDGAYYVGELTGFPFPVGGARVYRVVPGQAPTIYAEGFTNIIDVTFGPDGSLYVLEIAANGLLSNDLTGALIRVAPGGARTTIAQAGLVAPAGVAVGPDGALYVSNFGIFPDAGQVVRISAANVNSAQPASPVRGDGQALIRALVPRGAAHAP
jgi:hypothetical protein